MPSAYSKMKHILILLFTALLFHSCSSDYESADPSDDDNVSMDYQVMADWNLSNCAECKNMTPQEVNQQEAVWNNATEREMAELYTFSQIKRNEAEGRLNAYVKYLMEEKEEPPYSGSECTFTLTRGSGTWVKTLYTRF